MKFASLVLMSALFTAGVSTTHAEETMKEKAQATGNAAKRGVKKGAHRVQEALCMEGDVKCAAEKAGNRIEEGADATVDGAKKIKNKVN